MVGQEKCDLNKVLEEKSLEKIVEKALGSFWSPISCKIRNAADGLTGFLGDHFRAILTAKHKDGKTKILHLFVKTVPLVNQSKADFIVSNNFFRREELMFKIFEEFGGDNGPNAWRPKAYLYTDTILVMPDLAVEGYLPKHFLSTLDLQQVLTVAASVARFHAAFANYATRKITHQLKPYNFFEDHKTVMVEPTLCDSPWLRAAAKLTANLLNTFSEKYKNTIQDLEPKLYKLFLDSCDNLRHYDETLNVIVHRDLWMNNILFGENNAIIVYFQCVRYAPPAFDVTSLLYLTTTREFRNENEKAVLLHYYEIFLKSLDEATKLRLKELNYNVEEFLKWCEFSRMFSLFLSIAIFPYVLLDPNTAQRIFDNPETYDKYLNEDMLRNVSRI